MFRRLQFQLFFFHFKIPIQFIFVLLEKVINVRGKNYWIKNWFPVRSEKLWYVFFFKIIQIQHKNKISEWVLRHSQNHLPEWLFLFHPSWHKHKYIDSMLAIFSFTRFIFIEIFQIFPSTIRFVLDFFFFIFLFLRLFSLWTKSNEKFHTRKLSKKRLIFIATHTKRSIRFDCKDVYFTTDTKRSVLVPFFLRCEQLLTIAFMCIHVDNGRFGAPSREKTRAAIHWKIIIYIKCSPS